MPPGKEVSLFCLQSSIRSAVMPSGKEVSLFCLQLRSLSVVIPSGKEVSRLSEQSRSLSVVIPFGKEVSRLWLHRKLFRWEKVERHVGSEVSPIEFKFKLLDLVK